MKVLLINVNTGKGWGWGGIESHTDLLAATLHRRGHKVVLGCWTEGTVKVDGDTTLPSRRITIRNSGDVAAIMRIISVVRREEIEVIIANGGREYWPAALAAKALGRKVIFVRHQTDPIRKTTRWLVNRYVDRVVAVSGAVKGALFGSGIADRKIVLIHNAVSLARFDPSQSGRDGARKELGVGDNEALVGTIGKLNKGKGVYELLRAVGALAREHKDIRLIFVGEGPEGEGIIQEAQRLGIRQRVILTGMRRDVERMYAAMDIFVLPSTCDEAFGMVLIEAMAMARPVIGTMVGGIPELITDGKNGILVGPGSQEALAAAIKAYLSDSVFSSRIAAAGRRTVEEEFSDRTLGERFEEVFSSLEVR